MQRRKILYLIIMVLAVVMCVVFCYFFLIAKPSLLDRVSFRETVCDQEINLYHDETDDIYYLFLPAYVTAEELKIEKPNMEKISFSDEGGVNYGDNLAAVPFETNITLTLTNFHQRETHIVQFWQCNQLPTIYVETESGNLEYVNEDKENEEDASVLIVDAEGNVEFSGMSTITGRGNSTRNESKRPYNLKFDDMTDLMGDGEAETWCLLSNYADSSQIRNAVSNYIAREIGIEYTGKMEFVSLFINGEYLGLYNVTTKQAYRQDEEICAVFEQDLSDRPYDFMTDQGTCVIVYDGDEALAEARVEEFEKVLFNENTTYAEIGNVIDVSSFAKKWLVEAFVQDHDVPRSQYFSIDSEGKISAICAWDYDLTFGITWNEYFDYSYNFVNQKNAWYRALFQYEEFKDEVLSLLDQYSGLLGDSAILYLDQCCVLIENDWAADYVRWKNEAPFRSGRTGLKTDNYDLHTLEGNQDYIKDYICNRLSFLKGYWNHQESYCSITFADNTIGNITVQCERDVALSDDMIPDGLLSIPIEGFLGWYTEGGLSVADVRTVTEDMTFYGTWEEIELSDSVAETSVSEDAGIGAVEAENEPAVTSNLLVRMLKKVYHDSALDSFGRERLLVCGVFVLFFLCLIVEEIVRCRRQWKQEK